MSQPTKTTTSTPSYTADQNDIQSQLAAALKKRLAGGSASETDPIKTAAVGKVNDIYGNLQSKLQAGYSARGFGTSGKAALSSAQTEVSRAGDIGGLQSQFAQLDLDEDNKTDALAEQFGFTNPTQTQTEKTSGGVLSSVFSSLTSAAGLAFSLGSMGNGAGGGSVFSGIGKLFGGG